VSAPQVHEPVPIEVNEAVPRMVKITFPREAYDPASQTTAKQMYALARQLSVFSGQLYRLTNSYVKEAAIYLYRVRTKGELIPMNPSVLKFFETSPITQSLRARGLCIDFLADEEQIKHELSRL
jgi:hypothetical protein